MQVGDILRKKTARVVTVRMNETVGIAAQLMRASNISALVVKDVVRTEGNTAVGMFTERDVVRAIAEHGAAGVNLKVSQLISVQQAGVLLLDRYAGTCASSHEHAPHPPSAGHRQFTPDGVISMRDISTAFDEAATRRAEGGLTRCRFARFSPVSAGGSKQPVRICVDILTQPRGPR